MIENLLPLLIAFTCLALWIAFVYKFCLFLAEFLDRNFHSRSFRRGLSIFCMLVFIAIGVLQLYDFISGKLLHLSRYFPLSFLCAAVFAWVIWKDRPPKDDEDLADFLLLDEPHTDNEYCDLAAYLKENPDMYLLVALPEQRDLEFLRFFPELRRLRLELFNLKSLGGLRHLPDDLEYLSIGATRTKFPSLPELRRFKKLETLYLDGYEKNLAGEKLN